MGKGLYGTNGVKSAADLILLEQKGPESVENQGLEGSQPVGKDEVSGSNPDSSSTITALFVKKRAVLLYLRNFIVVIKHTGWRLTTHSATDSNTRPLEDCAPEALLCLSSLFVPVSAVLFHR